MPTSRSCWSGRTASSPACYSPRWSCSSRLAPPVALRPAAAACARRRRRPAVAKTAFALILLLLSQAALGRFTVLDQNSPWSVAMHLGNALLVRPPILYMSVRSASEPLPRARVLGAVSVLAWLCAL